MIQSGKFFLNQVVHVSDLGSIKSNNLKRIVITGGPSGGKTTLLELIQKQYVEHVAIAPEAASMLLRGGFARPKTDAERIHTQRAIFSLQRELEAKALAQCAELQGLCESKITLFCDRGSMDGAAYWPGTMESFVAEMGTSISSEYGRYSMVLHLQAAEEGRGYSTNEIRTESASEAALLDLLIARCWGAHPNYVFIPNGESFIVKLNEAFKMLERYLPDRSLWMASATPADRYATLGDLLASKK